MIIAFHSGLSEHNAPLAGDCFAIKRQSFDWEAVEKICEYIDDPINGNAAISDAVKAQKSFRSIVKEADRDRVRSNKI